VNWDGKEGRCAMYCANLSAEDWLSICDCWEAERCVPKGSINNPLTEGDLPFKVPVGGLDEARRSATHSVAVRRPRVRRLPWRWLSMTNERTGTRARDAA